MNVKKTFAGCLILAAVLTLAVVSAGCVNQPSGDEQGIDVPDVASLVSVEKTGTTYSIGDTMEVILTVPAFSKLYVKECDDGISVDMKEISMKHGDKELTCAKFTVTALKNGNHSFSIGNDAPMLERLGLDNVVYEDTVHVADTGAEPMTPRGVFTQIGERAPFTGEYTEIVIRGNAKTGYQWVAAENPGLIVSEPVYIPDEAPEGMVGTGGTYHWYVTAEAHGDYEFTAYEMPPAGDEPTGRVIVPLGFARNPADVPDVAALFSIEKTGITYNIGDTMEVILAVLDFSKLYVKECDDGISVDKKAVSVKRGDKEVTCAKFTVTAMKEGNHTFSIGIYEPRLAESGLDDVLYEDTVHVVDTGAEPMTPRGVFTRLIHMGHPAYPGDYYDISIRGNPTTGYKWVAAENPGLIVSEPAYIPDEAPEGMDGVGGTYHWYVTSDKPGEYEFTAYEMPPAGDEPAGRIIVPLLFVKKTN